MSSASLQLVVDQLGPVGHGKVTIRPLTVLIGRNNTGKTYVSQALYACRQALSNVLPRTSESLRSEVRDGLLAIAREQIGSSSNDGRDGVVLPESVRGYLSRLISETLEDAGRALQDRLKATFGIEELVGIATWGDDPQLRLEMRHDRALPNGDECLFGTAGSTASINPELGLLDLDWVEPDIALQRAFHRRLLLQQMQQQLFSEELSGDDRDERFGEFAWRLGGSYWGSFLEHIQMDGQTHYLPAGRSGLLNAWTDVVKLRIQLERERFGLPTFVDPSLDGVALDFIASLADVMGRQLRRRRRPANPFGADESPDASALDAAKALLEEVMEGKIIVEPDADLVPTLAYEQHGHRISIRHASSMVADLAPLSIWMERLLAPGDMLIVDEPESHLHPEAIRLVARVLVRLANAGVRVVCATHSSVLLHEISNAILRQETSVRAAADRAAGYLQDDCLRSEDVAVHRFDRSAPGALVKVDRVKIDPLWGIPEDEFVKVAQDLADDSARLVGQLD
ncbi:AAA family ATPase [Candidatus Poriferisodalis sp.]|uniref:AAA family ATPase n=1 Tax=Candidatus Poriferisodalis sp. TaxID=3101277 RepID=UPI003B0176E6